MSGAEGFRPGDRIQIRPELAEGYTQPWRNRVRKGLFGTIMSADDRTGWHVQLDMPKTAKWPHDWKWGSVRSDEMILVERPEPEARPDV